MDKTIPYVDKTGTDEKPDPMNMALLEFPRAMREVAKITAFGAKKHAPRGWQTFKTDYGIRYHLSKIGRHLLDRELQGEVNHADGGNLHMAAVAWNALATLENICKQIEGEKDRNPLVNVYDADMAASSRGCGRSKSPVITDA